MHTYTYTHAYTYTYIYIRNEKSQILDLVDFGDEVFSVESVIHTLNTGS